MCACICDVSVSVWTGPRLVEVDGNPLLRKQWMQGCDAVTRLRSGLPLVNSFYSLWCGCRLWGPAVMDREWRLDSRINGIVMKCCQTLHFVMSSVTSGVRNGEWIWCWRLLLFLSDLTRRAGNTNILSKHCSSSIWLKCRKCWIISYKKVMMLLFFQTVEKMERMENILQCFNRQFVKVWF